MTYLCETAGYNKGNQTISLDAESANYIRQDPFRVFNRHAYWDKYKAYLSKMPDFSKIHNTKAAGNASEENETQASAMAFQVLCLFFFIVLNPISWTYRVSHLRAVAGNLHHAHSWHE